MPTFLYCILSKSPWTLTENLTKYTKNDIIKKSLVNSFDATCKIGEKYFPICYTFTFAIRIGGN